MPEREFVGSMRATLDYMRTVEEFPTYARHTTMQTTSPRTGNTGKINTQRAGAYQPECTGSLFRGRQYNSVPSVAADSVAAESQSLPYPSRKPPTRGRQYTYDESTIQKAHQPWDSTREVCAFLALPSVQHARARLPKARPFMRLPALDSQKAPGAFILPEPSSPAQPPSYAQCHNAASREPCTACSLPHIPL